MSEESYQQNVRRGVTGIRTQTCEPASFDRISERTGVHPRNYDLFTEARRRYVEVCGEFPDYMTDEIAKQVMKAREAFYRDLGVDSLKKIVYFRANTELQLRRTLGRLAEGGFRTAVRLDIGGLHSVGVMHEDDEYYTAKSTWTPFRSAQVSTNELYEYLDQAPRLGRNARQKATRRAKLPNIVALPPEPKASRRR